MSVNHIYQPPLTHRIDVPGLILVLSNEYPNERTNSGALHLDPPPAQKWAEEGFCVMSILITGDIHQNQSEGEGVNLDWAKIISNCIAELEQKTELEAGKKYGLIVYEANFVEGILPHAVATPKLCCIVTYANLELASVLPRPLMQHIYSLGPRDSIAPQLSVQDTDNWSDIDSPGNITSPITTYRYILPDQTASSSGTAASLSTTPLQSFIHPSSPNYNHTYSTLAHTRTLTFLREQIGGPIFDIEAIWEAHTRFEFERRDVEGTMGTMVAEPYVNHIPTLTGGIGRTALTSFYTHHFIHSNPDSTRLELVSRTVGPDRVVDELVFEFVHDREIDWILPGVPPTGRHVRVPFVALVNIRGDKLYHEHIYWDQASVLVQIGLLPERLAFPGTTKAIRLPVAGVEQADKMLDPGATESNLLISEAARE